MSSAACRSDRAHRAALSAAHSARTRGMPTGKPGAGRRGRCTRTPGTTDAGRVLDRGTVTSMDSSTKPVIPCATRAAAPSSRAPGPLSHTARHSAAALPPGPTTTVCRPATRHRPALTSVRTASCPMPRSRSWARWTTPSWAWASEAMRDARHRHPLDASVFGTCPWSPIGRRWRCTGPLACGQPLGGLPMSSHMATSTARQPEQPPGRACRGQRSPSRPSSDRRSTMPLTS